MTTFEKIWIICMVAIAIAGFTLGCIQYNLTGTSYTGQVFTVLILGFFSILLPFGWKIDDMFILILGSTGFIGNLIMLGYMIFITTR